MTTASGLGGETQDVAGRLRTAFDGGCTRSLQ